MNDSTGNGGDAGTATGKWDLESGWVFLSPRLIALYVDFGFRDEEIAERLEVPLERVKALRNHLGL